MENIKPGWYYIAADGDGVGKKVGRAVIANDVDELHKVSNRIDAAQDFILHWCKDIGGVKISGGGDEFVAAIPPEGKDRLQGLRKSIEKSFGYTISVGVGRSLSEAGTALLVAKLRGKDRIVYFNKHIKSDIKKAKRRVREGRASQEEYKLSEAYLEKSESMLCELHKVEVDHNRFHSIAVIGNHPKYGKGEDRFNPEKIGDAISHAKNLKSKGYKVKIAGLKNVGGHEDLTHHILHKSENSIHKHEEGAHDPHSEQGTDDPCPYCADDEDNRTDDCQMCQDLDAQENADGTAGMHDCPACREYDEVQQNAGGVDDCPYCQETALNNSNPDGCEMCQEYDTGQGVGDPENITESQAHPDDYRQDHICNCPYCVANKKDESDLAVKDMGAEHPDNCPECQKMYSDAVEEQPAQTGQEDPNMQGHETAEQVLDLLDQEPGTGDKTPAQEAKQIDNTELPQGDQMKENASVKEDFGQTQKGDVSDSEKAMAQGGPSDMSTQGEQDEPDMTGVLQSGLDDHADEQKKQQVLDMVGQTLAGFKANKASLEATKEQNQALYSSCIQMLKSMIALCELLGLKPQAQPAPEQAAPEQAPPGQPPAAPQEGAPDPKAAA